MMLEQILAADTSKILPDKVWTEKTAIAFGSVRWYAIFIVIGFIVAIFLSCMKLWKRYKVSVEPFYWFVLFGVPLAIVGANFGSCVLGEPAGKKWSEFFTHFGEGLAIEWGILFVVVAAVIYFPLVLRANRYKIRDEFGPTPVVRKVSFWLYADAVMPTILIAQFLGRWGNYMNQEVYGAVVTSEGLAKWMSHNLPYMYVSGQWRQPLFFWEGLANLGMFLILYVGIEFVKVRKTGDMGAFYILWYGALRLGLEPLRDSEFKSTVTMIFSSIFVAFGVIFILLNHLVLARNRDKKLFNIITQKPVEKINCKLYPSKIEKLSNKINRTTDLDKKQELQVKLNETKAKWTKYDTMYHSEAYKAKFVRTEEQKLFFGRW